MDNQIDNIMKTIREDKEISEFIDNYKSLPKPYRGNKKIKLIILGQDPTIDKDRQIDMVLELDKNSKLKNYIIDICDKLNIGFDEIYATNLIKTFFTKRPKTLEKENKNKTIISRYAEIWFPVLEEELKEYEDVPILTLGQPVLKFLVNEDVKNELKFYWGYNSEDSNRDFKVIEKKDNKLNRIIIPFPHITTKNNSFYKNEFDNYCKFINRIKEEQ